jgi:hypothetical protein
MHHIVTYLTASSAEVKNAWSCASTPPTRLNRVVLSEVQVKFNLYLIRLILYVISKVYVFAGHKKIFNKNCEKYL